MVNGDLVGGAPQGEAALLHQAANYLLRPLLAAAIPELVDCSLPAAGGRNGLAVLAIRKGYAGQARRVAHACWGLTPFERTKCVVVVDADIDVQDLGAVLSRIAANVAPERDVFLHLGPADYGDHSSPTPGLGQQIGIDATFKISPEHPRPGRRAWNDRPDCWNW